ncbi:MAG: GNAT family N-acetyltransferase [Halalkalicoccus sp.]
MRIEPPATGETESIADLWVRLARGQRAFGSHLAAEANRNRIAETIAGHIANDTLLVARDGREVRGFVMFSIERRLYATDAVRGIVHNLFVVPDSRGRGIGSALLSAAETALFERGAELIALETLVENEDARRFYDERGYRPHRIEFEKRAETDNTTR